MTITITRLNDTDYRAVINDRWMSDGNRRTDACLRIVAGVLRSHEARGFIRTGGLMAITLGAANEAAVTALAVGDSVTLPEKGGRS